MSRWWRAYDDALHDPKVQRLPPHLFKTWFNLLCVASKHDGVLPSAKDIAFLLRKGEPEVRREVAELTARGLFDIVDDRIVPHNWDARQFKSDLSTQRVKAHRERSKPVSCNVSGNVSETPPDTDSEAETEKREEIKEISSPRAVAMRRAPQPVEGFQDFWNEYPRREGANPKQPASKKFEAKVRGGADPQSIIAGAKRYAAELSITGKIGTGFVAQAVTWLNQDRWKDYTEAPAATNGEARPIGWRPGMPTDEELRRQHEVDDGERPDNRH